MWSEVTPKKVLELDIFRILESGGLTEIGALYKVCSSKFVLALGSETVKEKLPGTEIQCRFGDSELCLNFWKRVGPLRNGKEPILVTIFFPELISDQAVRLAVSNFGEVASLKTDTNLTETSEMEKGMSKSSPWMKIQRYCQGKFRCMVVSKGISFLRNTWCCATGVKLGTCLARITLWLHPPLKILACLSLSRVVLLHRIKIL